MKEDCQIEHGWPMSKIRNAKHPLVVKKSRIQGEGVFAVKAIPWGVKIIEFQGARISNAEAAKRAANGATAIMESPAGLSLASRKPSAPLNR